MISALEVYRSLSRYVAARAVGDRFPGLLAGPLTPLRLVHRDPPQVRHDGWVRVRPRLSGICGSDLATLSGHASLYLSAVVSMPFVPGHEVVGETLDDAPGLPAGSRVVLDSVLACAARGLEPCDACKSEQRNRCDRVTVGHVSPGLQTGFCADTGGGWSGQLVAHVSQLHAVPDALADERAVLVEPLACAVHAARRAAVGDADTVLVVGAGAVGLFITLALRELTPATAITVVAKHRRQAELARLFGATDVVSPSEVVGGVRRATRALRLEPERGPAFLLGGVDVAIDAVGSRASIDTALRTTRAGGRVLLAGVPGEGIDLTPAWFRELEVTGAYATAGDAFDVAMSLAADAPLDGLLGVTYPLARWREALDHAGDAGRLGTVKVAFDLRSAA
ncbi:MAG TPA: alcohol dehydrogenase catalytic domain-containing protein [Mycobacteriales bacterium]|nr:alcohol dehydrogenase catalytic domain-containing protein [Mycobacteriales bacterium]